MDAYLLQPKNKAYFSSSLLTWFITFKYLAIRYMGHCSLAQDLANDRVGYVSRDDSLIDQRLPKGDLMLADTKSRVINEAN